MRNKIKTSCLIGVGLLAATGMSFAQSMPTKPSNPAQGMSNPGSGMSDPAPNRERGASAKRAIGEVISVNAKTGKLAVKTAEQDLNLNVSANAAKKELESIKVGDKVSISYRDQGGILVADSVSKSGATDGDRSSRKTN
jgi:hypothetical protein